MEQHRAVAEVAGALGSRQDEGVTGIDGRVHVEDAQWFADHPGTEVLLHAERLAEEGVRIARRVGSPVDRHQTEGVAPDAVGVEIALGPRAVPVGPRRRFGGHRRVVAVRVAGVVHAERVGGGRLRPTRPAQRGVVDEHRGAGTGEDGVHGLDHEKAEGQRAVGPPRHGRQAEGRLHGHRRHGRTADPVDVGKVHSGVFDGRPGGVTGEVRRRLSASVAQIGRRPHADERDGVAGWVADGGHHGRAAKTGKGAPERSIHSSSTGIPIAGRMPSLRMAEV